MEYYHDLVTERSWQELIQLNRSVDFVLIGGWATYLYTKQLKSKDIDIIVNFDQLSVLGKDYSLSKNDRLKKYEAVRDVVQIDIYLPHYSELGIPVEDAYQNNRPTEGFRVVDPNYLFILKMFVLRQRGRSVKGRKDLLDLISLLLAKKTDLPTVANLLEKYRLSQERVYFENILKENTTIPELQLLSHPFSKLKKEVLKLL